MGSGRDSGTGRNAGAGHDTGVVRDAGVWRGTRRWQTVLAVAAWLAVWQAAAWVVGSDLLLAGPVQTVVALVGLMGDGAFWAKIAWSFVRIAGGFVLAFAAAVSLAYLSWQRRAVETFLRPALSAIKSTPVVCIVVMLLIWFGSRWVSAVSVFLVVMPAIYFSALEGLQSLDPERLGMLRMYRVPRASQLGAYVWPQVQPFLLATSRMVVGMSWKAGVAAELIGTPVGSIGERIYQAKILLETAQVFAWTIVIVAIAYVCERVFLRLLAASVAWGVRRAVSVAGDEPLGPSADVSSRTASSDQISAKPALAVSPGVTVAHLSKAFGNRVLFHDLTCGFAAGSRTCVMAPSGSGKTTLLRMVAGLEVPDAGETACASGGAGVAGGDGTGGVDESDGSDRATVISEAATAPVSMAYQATCLLEGLSAVENVELAARLAEDGARRLLTELLPADVLDKPVSTLSGGERRRVELVRAMAAGSGVVLLDEPFASLDEDAHARCAQFVLAHQRGRTVLVATHDASDAVLLDADVFSLEDNGFRKPR